MIAALTLLAAASAAPVDTVLQEVHQADDATRAVVLIHGYWPAATYPIARTARLHDWQKPGAPLVESLGTHADVYALGYGQDATIDAIAPVASEALGGLSDRYDEVVLVGHSAGGIMARLIVEDHPDAGVDRVVQVCSPNAGAGLGRLGRANLKPQEAFVGSLSPEARASKQGALPADVELVSVVCDGAGLGDGVLADAAQWPEDLQEAGVPSRRLNALHFTAMRTRSGVDLVTELATSAQPRWSDEEVREAADAFLGW